MTDLQPTALPLAHARWPWWFVAGFGLAATTGFTFVVIHDEPVLEQVGFLIAFGMFGVVGALIVSRDRRNAIGVLFLYGSSMTALSFLAGELTTSMIRAGREDALTIAIAILGNVGWLVGIVPVLFLLLLLFPDGRLPSPRWRWVLYAIFASVVVVFVATVFGLRRLSGSSEIVAIDNPLYRPAVADAIGWIAKDGWTFLLMFGLVIAALVTRFRRSRGVERQQIAWFVAAALFAFASVVLSELILTFAPELEGLDSVISGLAFLALPVSVGVAILRYRLYDLDVVIRKTIVYALLVVFATAVYLAVVVGIGAWLGRDNSLLTMVAAVLVAVTFQPVRDRLTRFANRLVYGRRATPYEVLAEFSERVGDAYSDEDVLPRMVRILGEGVAAERADVFLKVGAELRDVAAWPSDAPLLGPVAMSNGDVPDLEGADRVYRVEHAGELLGALAVRKPSSDPLTPADEKLVRDLAAQAGLVLRNVRLNQELRARLDDLRAAQKRLVQAQDEERRRLERNIHDGAQQQLVAIAVKARLARGLTERDPEEAAMVIEEIEGEMQAALDDLRDLARGIYPPLLADRGLVAALDAQGRRSPVEVAIDAADVGRYPPEVEAAAYFSVLEALQNVAKYARASSATVSLQEADGNLEFIVHDDGRGFDPERTLSGSGLQGIADRLGALDGVVEVSSEPGHGTTVRGRIPLRADERAVAH